LLNIGARYFALCLSTFLLLFSANSYCQTNAFKGRITDKLSNEPLAFVNVIYGKGNLGTTTNIDGWFSIKNPAENLTLSISYIGYEKVELKINSGNVKQPFIIELTPLAYNLNEVTVLPGENPANGILKKVISNKEINNPEKLPSFSYLSYSRLHFTLATEKIISVRIDTVKITHDQYNRLANKNKKDVFRDFLNKQHLFLMETVSKRNYNGPGKNKETVIASKTSGLQQPYIFLLANQFQSFSVYGEEFALGTKKYVSPVCNTCTGKYFYLIEDTMYNEIGDTIFVLSFRPSRGKNFNGLSGVMQINSNRYAVENISAEPTEKDTMMDIRIQQKYSFVDGKAWFPSELNTNMTLNNFSGILVDTVPISDSTAIKSKQRFVFAGIGKSYLDSINLNPELENVKFNQVEVSMDKNVILNNPSYFDKYRPDSLTEKDLNTYNFIDSIGKEANLDNKMRIVSYAMTGYIPWNFLDIDLYRLISYNDFEGFRAGFGVKTNDKILNWAAVGGYAAYGFTDEIYKYGYSLRFKQPTPGDAYIEIGHFYDVHEPGKSEFTPKKNFASNEIYRSLILNKMDYEKQDYITACFRPLNYVALSITASENYINPDSAFNYLSERPERPGGFEYRQAGIKIRFLYNEKFTETFFGRISMGSDYPDVNIACNYFQPTGSEAFVKTELKVSTKFNFHFAGTTKATLRAGMVNGKAPLFLAFNGNGSYAPFSLESENTFQTMRPFEFFSTDFFSLFLRHSFGHLLFKTGKFKPGIELSHNTGISTDLTEYPGCGLKSFNSIYIESGLVISNLFKLSFTGYGIGVYYRYGFYSSSDPLKNIFIKLDLRFSQ